MADVVSEALLAAFARALGRNRYASITLQEVLAISPERLLLAMAMESADIRYQFASHLSATSYKSELEALPPPRDHDGGCGIYLWEAMREPRGDEPPDCPHVLRALKARPTPRIAHLLGIGVEQPTGSGTDHGKPEEDVSRAAVEEPRADTLIRPERILDHRYRLISSPGAGSGGRVFRAEDIHLGRTVAIKILHSRFSQDQDFVGQFRHEALTLARLNHPNIAGIFDRGATDRALYGDRFSGGSYYIVTQWLDGPNLAELLREHDRFDPAFVVDVASQAAAGLSQAHALGIVHCDIKPSNIILAHDEFADLPRVVIVDFGVAGTGGGTVAYMAPEQHASANPTPLWDVFALGATCAHLLLGFVPPRSAGGALAMPGSRHALANYLSILARATRADPSQRHPTVTALAQELQSADADELEGI